MVRILELMEDELDLPKPLSPGTTSHIDGNTKSDYETMKALDTIRANQIDLKKLYIKANKPYRWISSKARMVTKSPEEMAAGQQQYLANKDAIVTQSLRFVNEVENAIPFIEKNCSKYLPIIHNFGFLYRGFSLDDVGHSVFYGFPRGDRKAKDSISDFQTLFDKVLESMGVKALRHNSLFCSSEKGAAEGYGLTYIVIPCNDAVFAWSENYHDIVLDRFNHPKFSEGARKLTKGEINFKTFAAETQDFFQIRTNDLETAINLKHEVWIYGHYVAILATLEPQLKKLLFG